MNTTYSLNKEEVLDRVKSRLEHFDIKAEEWANEKEEWANENKTVWSCKVLFRTELVGFINCIHRTGQQDEWSVLRHIAGVISLFSTTDFDAAIDYLMS